MRVVVFLFCLAFLMLPDRSNTLYAQPGLSEFQQANADLGRSFFSMFDATMVLAGIFGICGGLKIYYNWQMGKDRITADVAAWFFAALFMILMGPFLRTLFGL
jgi:phage shock protein PspC (stress-responsive transcriptional regulator)